jgi:hypothetical protein
MTHGKEHLMPYEESAAIEQALADADDLAALRSAKKEEEDATGIPLERVLEDLKLPS